MKTMLHEIEESAHEEATIDAAEGFGHATPSLCFRDACSFRRQVYEASWFDMMTIERPPGANWAVGSSGYPN